MARMIMIMILMTTATMMAAAVVKMMALRMMTIKTIKGERRSIKSKTIMAMVMRIEGGG